MDALPPAEFHALVRALVVGGSLGALVGLERQWDDQSKEPGARVVVGARTFCLWGLLGVLCGHFGGRLHPLVFAAGMLAVAGWTAAHLMNRNSAGSGLTTAASALLVYLAGGLAVSGESRVAVMLTVVLLFLLVGKRRIHRVSRHIRSEDVRMALQFLAVSGVILPLVPDRSFGPYGAFNPRSVWLMVVIVSGLGFAGYLAVRALGASRGIALTGLAGGLASSTATTLSMSRLSRERPEIEADCALAIGLACTVMLWRVGVLILAVSPELAVAFLPEMLAMSVPGLAFGAWHLLSGRRSPGGSAGFKNPLSLVVALQFAALYAVVVFVAKAANAIFGSAGLLAASFFSGLTDLDAIALSISNIFAAGNLAGREAVACVGLAAVANSATKLGLAWGLGSPGLRVRIGALLGSTIVIGTGLLVWRLSGE